MSAAFALRDRVRLRADLAALRMARLRGPHHRIDWRARLGTVVRISSRGSIFVCWDDGGAKRDEWPAKALELVQHAAA